MCVCLSVPAIVPLSSILPLPPSQTLSLLFTLSKQIKSANIELLSPQSYAICRKILRIWDTAKLERLGTTAMTERKIMSWTTILRWV